MSARNIGETIENNRILLRSLQKAVEFCIPKDELSPKMFELIHLQKKKKKGNVVRPLEMLQGQMAKYLCSWFKQCFDRCTCFLCFIKVLKSASRAAS